MKKWNCFIQYLKSRSLKLQCQNLSLKAEQDTWKNNLSTCYEIR